MKKRTDMLTKEELDSIRHQGVVTSLRSAMNLRIDLAKQKLRSMDHVSSDEFKAFATNVEACRELIAEAEIIAKELENLIELRKTNSKPTPPVKQSTTATAPATPVAEVMHVAEAAKPTI